MHIISLLKNIFICNSMRKRIFRREQNYDETLSHTRYFLSSRNVLQRIVQAALIIVIFRRHISGSWWRPEATEKTER